MDRDALYRDCALQAGLVQLAETDDGRVLEKDDVDRVPGGAWVTCAVYISNGEVSELLSRERKERRVEAESRRTMTDFSPRPKLSAEELADMHAEVGELAERITEGRTC